MDLTPNTKFQRALDAMDISFVNLDDLYNNNVEEVLASGGPYCPFNPRAVSSPLSLNKSLERSINKSLNKSLNKSINKSLSKSLNKSLDKSLERSLKESLNKSLNKSLSKSLETSLNKSLNKSLENKGVLNPITGALLEERRRRTEKEMLNSPRVRRIRPSGHPALLAKFREAELEKCITCYDMKLAKLIRQKEMMLNHLENQKEALQDVNGTLLDLDTNRSIIEDQMLLSPDQIKQANLRRQRALWKKANCGRQLAFDDALDGSVLVNDTALCDADDSILSTSRRLFPGGRRSWYGNYMSNVAPKHRALRNRNLSLLASDMADDLFI